MTTMMMMRPIGLLFTVTLASCILLAVLATDNEHPNGMDPHESHRGRKLQSGNEIVGGSVQTTLIPYFVNLDGCGGSLISEDTVLTAAHCVDGFSGENNPGFPSRVFVGALTDSDGFEVQVDKSKSIVHPLWTGDTDNTPDVAVLKLVTPVNTDTYPPIKLNDCGDTPFCADTGMIVYGLGAINEDGDEPSPVLKKLDLLYKSGESTGNVIYAAAENPDEEDSCFGDSGGPLVLNGDLQVGIVSFGQTDFCADGNSGGYSRISTYFGWIQEQVCEISSDPGDHFNCGAAAAAWYETRQGVIKSVDAIGQVVGVNLRGELGQVAGRLGFSG
jgi:Trypsin